MAEWNIINSATLLENRRFDADYWRPRYVDNLQRLSESAQGGLTCKPIKDVVTKVTGSAFYPSFVGYYGDEGLPFLRVADLGDLFVKVDSLVRINSSIIRAHKQVSTIDPEDLVVAKGGSIGGVCIVTDDLGETAVCRDVIAIKTDNRSIDPYYLAVFLNTEFGQLQLERNKSQQVQAHLTFPAVERMAVAYPERNEQLKIRNLAVASYKAAANSKNAYTQAQQLLESKLGLDKLRFDKPVGYTARFSELESSLRFDPEHFYPTFKALCAGLSETVSLEPLYRFAHPLKTGIQPTYLEDGEYEVINSKHIGVNKIETSKLRRASPAPYSVMADNGDVLLNATGRGTLGRCAVLESDTPHIFDVCIIRIRPVGINPYFLAALLNTRFGQLQMELHTRGTSGQLHLYPRDARKILIWPAPESLQEEVRELMTKAARSAQEATQLLDQAKSCVEQLIEEAAQR